MCLSSSTNPSTPKRNVVLPSKCFCFLKGFDYHLQAYTNELELEVAHLQAENAKLRRQQDQINKQAERKFLLFFALKRK